MVWVHITYFYTVRVFKYWLLSINASMNKHRLTTKAKNDIKTCFPPMVYYEEF